MMKWSSILSTAALTTAVFAHPIATSGGGSAESLVLRVKSDDPAIDGRFVAAKHGHLGFTHDGTAESAIRVSTNKEKEGSDKISLHTKSVDDADHTLGLVGEHGLFDFLDLTESGKGKDEPGLHWAEFVVGDNHELIWGRKDKMVVPGWVASPEGDDYKVKYYDNEDAFATQDYIPIQIQVLVEEILEATQDPQRHGNAEHHGDGKKHGDPNYHEGDKHHGDADDATHGVNGGGRGDEKDGQQSHGDVHHDHGEGVH